MKYILIKDLPPVFIPAPDKEVFVKDDKVYINRMFGGLIGTLEDCLASGFVKEVNEKKKVIVWQNFYKSGTSRTGFISGSFFLDEEEAIEQVSLRNWDYIGTFPTEIEVEE